MQGIVLRGLILTAAVVAASCSDKATLNNVGEPDMMVESDMAPADMAESGDMTGVRPNYHEDIAPLLAQRCVKCHSEEQIAPFNLDTYEEVAPIAELILTEVTARRMPPFRIDNSGECGKFGDYDWLSQDEIDLLTEWTELGTPEGDPALNPNAEVEQAPSLDRVDVELALPSYTPDDTEEDDYRCFVMDPGIDSTQYVTAFEVVPDNDDLVHHAIVYNVLTDEAVATAEALDEAEEGPGYTCFGDAGTDSDVTLYAGWAPGTGATYFPEGTGIELPAGRKVVVQVHYNTLAGTRPDATVVNFQTEASVPRLSFITLLADSQMALAPGDSSETLKDEPHPYRGPAFLSGVPLTIYGAFPHMHSRGETIEMDHFRGDGGTCAARLTEWDFNWQRMYWYERPFVSEPGDLFRLRCTYDTSGTSEPIGWGDGTGDEMCVMGLYIGIAEDPDAVAASEIGEPRPGFMGDPGEGTHSYMSFGSSGADMVSDIEIADDGSVFIAMQNDGDDVDVAGEVIQRENRSGTLAKLDAERNVVWTLVVDGSGQDSIEALEIDQDGSVIIAGYFGGDDARIGTQPLPAAVGGWDFLLARVSSDGDVVWVTTVSGPGDNFSEEDALRIDGEGNIVVGAAHQGTVMFAGTNLDIADATPTLYTPALLKFDGDGNELWGLSLPVTAPSQIRGIDIDEAGNIVAAGFFQDSLELPGETLRTRGHNDGFVISLPPDGSVVRWKRHLGSGFRDVMRDVLVDGDGNFIIAGNYSAMLEGARSGDIFAGGLDAVLLKLDGSTGDTIWARQLGGQSHESFRDVEFNGNGALVAMGMYQGAPDLGSGDALYNAGVWDIVLTTFSVQGDVERVDRLGTPAAEDDPQLAVHGYEASVLLMTGGAGEFGATKFGQLDVVLADIAPAVGPLP